jgi:hypothetical protein
MDAFILRLAYSAGRFFSVLDKKHPGAFFVVEILNRGGQIGAGGRGIIAAFGGGVSIPYILQGIFFARAYICTP